MSIGRSAVVVWGRSGRFVPLGRGLALLVAWVLAVTVGAVVAGPAYAAPKPAAPPKQTSAPDLVSAQVSAKAQGTRIEVEGLRTETSTTWVNPDGTLTTEAHAAPVRFKDAKGVWKDVDVSLGESTDGSARARSHRLGLSLSGVSKGAAGGARAKSGTDLVSTEEGKGRGKVNRQVSLGWPGMLPTPTLRGATATYSNVESGVDVKVTSLRNGFEQFTIVKDRATLERLTAAGGGTMRVVLPMRTAGLTPRAERDGSVSFVDATGAVASRIEAPMAWDAAVGERSGDPVNVSPVAMDVTVKGPNRAVLTLTPNADWLADPARQFPITIDPTYASGHITTSGDTFVQSAYPGVVYSSSTELRVGTADGGGNKARSYLAFPLSGLKGLQVKSAQLSLYETYSYSCTAAPVLVYEPTTIGTISSMTWNNQPPNAVKYGSLTTAKGWSSSCAAGRIYIPMTSLAQKWSTSAATVGELMVRASETDNSGWKKFSSVETGTDPVLTFTYNRKPNAGGTPTITGGVTYTPPSGTVGTYTADTTPEIATVATDPDGNTYRSTIEVHTSTTTSASTLKATCATAYVASGATAKCTVPAGSALTNNTTYYARAAILDDQGLWNGTWSPWTTVRVGSSAPAAPSMTCASPYLDSSWSYTIPASITCTVTVTGTSWSAPSSVLVYDNGALVSTVAVTPPTSAATSANFTYKPTKGGHHLLLTARNPAGVSSATQGSYDLGFGDAVLQVPTDKSVANGTVNVSATLQKPTSTGTLQAHLQYRLPKDVGQTNGWVSDSSPLVTDVKTTPSGGTVLASGTWNLGAITAAQLAGVSDTDTTVFQVRVCVHTTTDPTCLAWTSPNTITRPAFGAGGVTDSAGGAGSVDLSTGVFSTSAGDVSIPGLSVGRAYDTLGTTTPDANPSKGVFGPGWTSTLDGGPNGITDWTVEDVMSSQGHFVLASPDGATTYSFGYPGGASGLYFASSSATETVLVANSDDAVAAGGLLKLTRAASATSATLSFTDADGTTTTWTGPVNANGTATAIGQWVPAVVTAQGSGAATMKTTTVAGKVASLVSAPKGLSCDAATWDASNKGCVRVDVNYATSTSATSSLPGDFVGQVSSITGKLWDVDAQAFTSNVLLASYAYDTDGQLVRVKDERTQLTTSYGYTSTKGRLASITQPGRAPYRLWFDAAGKITAVSRDDATSNATWTTASGATPPAGSTYLARYAYSVPLAGNGSALPTMTTTGVAPWFQGADGQGNPTAPSYGFAVFGPSYPFASALPTSASDANWHYAQITYTRGDYTPVNTAQFGAGRWLLTATDLNADGSVARTLDSSAIAAVQDQVSAGKPLTRSQVDDMSTQTKYAPEAVAAQDTTLPGRTVHTGDVITPGGTYVTDTYEPIRDAVVGGTLTQGVRNHTQLTYGSRPDNPTSYNGLDPETGLTYGLVTEQKVFAESAGAPGQSASSTQVAYTVNGYGALAGDSVSGWELGAPTTVTQRDWSATSPKPDITRTKRYDADGRTIETRQPSVASSATPSNDPGTRVTTYYTTATTGTCGHPEWEGRVCTSGPASGPLPTTTYTYDTWGGVKTVTDRSAAGTILRTYTTTFDGAGRPSGTTVSANVTGSTAQPGVTVEYSSQTGEQIKVTKAGSASAVSSSTDGWGRTSSYSNDLGDTTTTAYNATGQVSTISNFTGVTSFTYDGTDANGLEERRGLPTKLTVSRATTTDLLTYKGAYNVAGQLVKQTMPGAMAQISAYDRTGQLTNLMYTGQVTPVTESIDANDNTVWTPGTPLADQPWLAWTRDYDALGRVADEYNGQGAAFDGTPGVSDPTDIKAPSVGRATAADLSYTYDYGGRLTTVADRTATQTGDTVTPDTAPSDGVPCEIRQYGFDLNGNRTSSAVLKDANGDCASAVADTAKNYSYSYNGADQALKASDGTDYAYDGLGRQTAIPAADAPYKSAGDVTIGYYDSDAVRAISQGGTSTTYGLDSVGRRLGAVTARSTGTTSATRHYVDGSDNPGWSTDAANQRIRYTPSLNGLGASIAQDGGVSIMLANPHGDNVASVAISANQPESVASTGITGWSVFDEYGNATQNPIGIGYGYLGSAQREASSESAGLTLMGYRLYSPSRGHFTSVDPIFGGNDTAYSYPTDPVNASDVSGAFSWSAYKSYKTFYSSMLPATLRPLVTLGNKYVITYYTLVMRFTTSEASWALWGGGVLAAINSSAAYWISQRIANTFGPRAALYYGWASLLWDWAEVAIGFALNKGWRPQVSVSLAVRVDAYFCHNGECVRTRTVFVGAGGWVSVGRW